ncbi:MAG: flagellar assembly protein FliX [Rhodospirillales bacterium]|nr:flagellar assembly protein FliX [Rhodospirillales bacterium]
MTITTGIVRAGTATRPARRKGALASSGQRFAPEASEAAAHDLVPELAALGAPGLLAMQEVATEADPGARRAGAVRRGEDLLDRLDGLRLALVAGAVSVTRLDALAGALKAEREATEDPRLDDLIGEIELRAAVELAKFGRRRVGSAIPPRPRNDQLLHLFSEP